jgi:hypothetical protein
MQPASRTPDDGWQQACCSLPAERTGYRCCCAMESALRPAFMMNGSSPLAWGREEWSDATQRREDGAAALLHEAVIKEHFDREQFLRDGVALLPGVMTDEARLRWAAATQGAQDLNDCMISAAPGWPDLIDWPALGRAAPSQVLTQDEISRALGTSQAIHHADRATDSEPDPAGIQTLRKHSVIPEYFPAGHVGELLHILMHPQMLELNARLLGCRVDDVRFDHNQLLNRRPGYAGGAWHSHPIGAGMDDAGCQDDLRAYDTQPNLCICLCCE